jgi:hypothetical protein
LPSLRTCGLMIAQLQLLRRAVVLTDPPKIKSSSLWADGLESDPWHAFL